MVLFKNDSNCMYTSCAADFKENFALVLNSITIKRYYAYKQRKKCLLGYWDSSYNNNTLYGVRVKIDTAHCDFTIGFDYENQLHSDRLGNATDKSLVSKFTNAYDHSSMNQRG